MTQLNTRRQEDPDPGTVDNRERLVRLAYFVTVLFVLAVVSGFFPFAIVIFLIARLREAIRGIGEKFAANPVTGTGSFSIPLSASPGRGGFGPQLSLSYDSGSGNGPFGFGWSLAIPAGLIYGFTWFCIFLEGQTVPLGLPFVVIVAALAWIRGRQKLGTQPILAFFFLKDAKDMRMLEETGKISNERNMEELTDEDAPTLVPPPDEEGETPK